MKTASVVGSTPRVTVNAVVQENAGELFVNPDLSTELLNDRPSLRLDAIVNHPNGASFPITVIVNHLRSLNGVDDDSPGSNGWPTDGRPRARQAPRPGRVARQPGAGAADRRSRPSASSLVGDFNAFEFNDGLVDSMGVIAGTPTPDNQTVVLASADLVNPDLDNLFDTPPRPSATRSSSTATRRRSTTCWSTRR